MIVNEQKLPDQPPPLAIGGVIGWLRNNLFDTKLNTLLTLVVGYLLFTFLLPLLQWAFVDADWIGESRNACDSGGACWVFVSVRLDQFLYGFYPESEYWRINTLFGLLLLLLGAMVYEKTPRRGLIALFTLVVFPVIAFFMLLGGSFGLPLVETHKWGGLTLTLVLALVGIVASLPIGIMLALGRRSEMPIVRSFCTVFIELWRGVPLITILFMASVMLPLFAPEEINLDKLVRALIGITLFQSAYMAEVIRAGLQAIPKGQYEAADALGLSYWKKTGLIIMPQALKIVIPGIVNTFIALFKDTSLVLIIGLFDLLAIVQSALADPDWLGYSTEGYVFVAFVFWIFCFTMSRYSQYLERKLHTGHVRT